MLKPVPNGKVVEIQGLKCCLPPMGFGYHNETGELAKVELLKRSEKPKEQYWEAPYSPDDISEWNEWYEEEREKQESDPDYLHPQLHKVRQREWHRRLHGLWIYINGEPTYLTGIHYFFLTYWRALDTDYGLPDYRHIDTEYFYFWQYVVEDPKCYGIIEIRKRRDGKSYRAACIVYECISRSKLSHGGIQSKNWDDAQDFFQVKLINAFKTLPKFFVPEYDTAQGDTPKEELRFFRPSKKGKGAKVSENKKVPELKSTITFKDRQAKAYDGRRLKRLVLDESGKVEINIMGRHAIVKYCLMDHQRRIVGKMIVTSTVEEIGVKFGFKKLWEDSNQYEREKNGMTKSGLYKFFISAARSGNYDVYGIPDVKGTLEAIKADRDAYLDDPDELNSLVRKEPLSEREAFTVATNECHFNSVALNERLGELESFENHKERGNLVWKNGQRDTEVVWVKDPRGKWEICYLPDEPNKVLRKPNYVKPLNDFEFICGVDTIDIDLPKDMDRASKPAAVVKRRLDPLNPEHPYSNAYVCKYIPSKRMKAASEFYEDLIKTLVYYGCSALYERNKSRLNYHFEERGYSQFLITLPAEKEPGVYAGSETKPVMLELLQEYVKANLSNVFFEDIIKDWLKFDIKDSTPNDLSMATGWCEYGDRFKINKRKSGKLREITDYFKLHKIS